MENILLDVAVQRVNSVIITTAFCRVLPFFGHFLEVSQDKGLMKNFQRLWPSV